MINPALSPSENLWVRANRRYAPNEVRHLQLFPNLKSSVSGQYAGTNFAELVRRIQSVVNNQKIYFVDTRQDTHFELNGLAVCLKTDDNSALSSAELVAKEAGLTPTYLHREVLFTTKKFPDDPEKLKDPTRQDWTETVNNVSTIKEFIEQQEGASEHYRYVRLALDEHGPMTDDQVDQFLSLLSDIKKENAWLHTNHIVEGASAALLIVLEALLQNPSEPLEAIVANIHPARSFLSAPKEDDINRQKKLDRADFIKKFQSYAQTAAGRQSWTDWKKGQL